MAPDLLQVSKVSINGHLLVQKFRPVWRHAVSFRHNKYLRRFVEMSTFRLVVKTILKHILKSKSPFMKLVV